MTAEGQNEPCKQLAPESARAPIDGEIPLCMTGGFRTGQGIAARKPNSWRLALLRLASRGFGRANGKHWPEERM